MDEAIFGLLGVIVGGVISGAKEFWMTWYKRRKDQEYLAIRVATYLDYFSERCAEIVGDRGEEDQHGITHPGLKEPEFDLNSVEVEWKSISAELMYRILNYSNLLLSAKNQIQAVAEHSDLPDFDSFFQERQLQYASLGLEAIEIATVLRKMHKLPARDYVDWNPKTYLLERQQEILNRQEARRQQTKALIASLKSKTQGQESGSA